MGASKNGHVSAHIVLHQISFLLTGLCTTLGVQWLFYRGAATSMSFLPQLSSYTGMLLVGLFIPILLKRKITAYHTLFQEEEQQQQQLSSSLFVQTGNDKLDEEGLICHVSIIKLSVLEIISSFTLMIGFSIVGSGVQWIAILGTSFGLGLSSLDNFYPKGPPVQISADQGIVLAPSSQTLFQGTLMTLAGTFISACIYVYSDTVLSKNKLQPLPARVCYWIGVYTSLFSWVWIMAYTLPRIDTVIHVDEHASTTHIVLMYLVVTMASALHSWNYYELIESTGNVS
ncbi:uncharacterized protein B0P05DRAFT_475801 [Gilbertella persicaria]|uniref:uncharacterized protein n=1 Tax=Gilbertella persicaria TaxID=101096 RepID=UPI00221E7982|nr:uncharacterized protein B0P05DRAFT_475801 [Gilbertella persicaria]KAI8066273.1 hypothetical protein B0P05DRAFT_475801 [Gilbertella persicaria]